MEYAYPFKNKIEFLRSQSKQVNNKHNFSSLQLKLKMGGLAIL